MNYVSIFARPVNTNDLNTVLMCYRLKDDFQKGRFNLVGGKIESGESIIDAAIRELKEETGLSPAIPGHEKIMGKSVGLWGQLHFVRITVPYINLTPAPKENNQYVSWVDWEDIINSGLILPDLKIILPLISQGISGWTVETEIPEKTKFHKLSITIEN